MGANNKLSSEEILRIRNIYKEVRSVEKTAKITKHAPMTVHNYVRNLSCEDPRSPHQYRTKRIIKVDPITGKKVGGPYKSQIDCCRKNNIDKSQLCKHLQGELLSCHGYIYMSYDLYDAWNILGVLV